MDVRPPIETTNPTAVLSVSFNDDGSCFVASLETGLCIFHIKSCLLKAYRDFNAGIGIAEMMGTTNYLALVGGGRSPKFAINKAIIWDDMKGKVALEISTLSAIRGVKLARERILVILQASVRVHTFAKPSKLLHIYETADNPHGLCALSNNQLALPGRTAGQIQLINLRTENVSIIPAHSSALRALRLSRDGQLLASASENGTLIRVYSTANCARVAELRRGIDPSTIYSLAFSPSGCLLACTSDKGTLHIFEVPQRGSDFAPRGQAVPVPGSGGDIGKWSLMGKIPLMPRFFSDVYSITSASFEAGDDKAIGGIPLSDGTMIGTMRPAKGIIGWLGESSLAVIGAGRDARWEKFALLKGDDGKLHCVREGWKRFLGSS